MPPDTELMVEMVCRFFSEWRPASEPYVAVVSRRRKPSRPKKHGRPRNDWHRDRLICEAVVIVARHGFRPTRNETTRIPSGCSIVAAALQQLGVEMREAGVARIWERRDAYGASFGMRERLTVGQ